MITFKKVAFLENRPKPLEIQTLFHLGDMNPWLLEFTETMEIQILFQLSQQSQNCTFGGFPEKQLFKSIHFLKIMQNPLQKITFPVSKSLGFHILFAWESENVWI